ncbi:hypothetical protein IWQ62_005593 [Dispira parvispora]|uniref:Uncharacterized protein n=1 Tax=Dispira parvispora TaxID=1520584 RepID=A0A9W8E538_9FUNG|nr:hypothetical protein IWQ62_005593 [Dispira parvispora]
MGSKGLPFALAALLRYGSEIQAERCKISATTTNLYCSYERDPGFTLATLLMERSSGSVVKGDPCRMNSLEWISQAEHEYHLRNHWFTIDRSGVEEPKPKRRRVEKPTEAVSNGEGCSTEQKMTLLGQTLNARGATAEPSPPPYEKDQLNTLRTLFRPRNSQHNGPENGPILDSDTVAPVGVEPLDHYGSGTSKQICVGTFGVRDAVKTARRRFIDTYGLPLLNTLLYSGFESLPPALTVIPLPFLPGRSPEIEYQTHALAILTRHQSGRAYNLSQQRIDINELEKLPFLITCEAMMGGIRRPRFKVTTMNQLSNIFKTVKNESVMERVAHKAVRHVRGDEWQVASQEYISDATQSESKVIALEFIRSHIPGVGVETTTNPESKTPPVDYTQWLNMGGQSRGRTTRRHVYPIIGKRDRCTPTSKRLAATRGH